MTVARRPAGVRALRRAFAASMWVLTACASPEATTPEAAVERFYTMLDALGVRRLPDASALASLRPFIEDTLATRLATPSVATVPPSGAGAPAGTNPWASLHEGYTAFRIRLALDSGATVRVPVAFSNEEQRPAVTWVDTVIVVRQHDRYVVADVRYGAGWDFAARGTLRQALAR